MWEKIDFEMKNIGFSAMWGIQELSLADGVRHTVRLQFALSSPQRAFKLLNHCKKTLHSSYLLPVATVCEPTRIANLGVDPFRLIGTFGRKVLPTLDCVSCHG